MHTVNIITIIMCSIPTQILEKILMYLTFEDIVSLNLVCQRLTQIIRESGRMWKHLLWTMYPGASLLKYPVNKYPFGNAYEETFTENCSNTNNANNGKYDEGVELSDSSDSEPRKVAKTMCSQIEKAKNYWKRQFRSRHSIGINSKNWVER